MPNQKKVFSLINDCSLFGVDDCDVIQIIPKRLSRKKQLDISE